MTKREAEAVVERAIQGGALDDAIREYAENHNKDPRDVKAAYLALSERTAEFSEVLVGRRFTLPGDPLRDDVWSNPIYNAVNERFQDLR